MKCKWCGGPMEGTRRREYCGGKCRVAAWRARRRPGTPLAPHFPKVNTAFNPTLLQREIGDLTLE